MPTRAARRTLVAALAVSATAGHVVYPAALAMLTRGRRGSDPVDPRHWPALTVVVPAYREAGVVAAKLRGVLDNGYPGQLEVLVIAEDQPTADAARSVPGVRVVEPERRLGKAQALNLAVREASHDVLVMTDANNRLLPDALRLLVRRLGPGDGAVAGAKGIEEGGGEDLYWRFESWLKEREALLGSTIAVVGELFAVRREAWRPIPTGIGIDDLWIACDLQERGWRIAYAPDARTSEPPLESLLEEWDRRTKLTAGSLAVYWDKRRLVAAGGLAGWELLGHRIWRSTIGPASHGALLVMAVGSARRSRFAQLFLAGHAAAAAAVLRPVPGLPLPAKAAGQVLFLQAVAWGGWVRRLRGDRVVAWEKAAR